MTTKIPDKYASEEQKAKLLPAIRRYDIVGGWGLTERYRGSDASNIQTTCTRVGPGKWLLNGNKRWIGNANREMMVVFAKNTADNKVLGFLLHLDDSVKGLKREKIVRKMSLRGVANMQLDFENVEVSEEWRMPGVRSFRDVADMLAHSRQYVGWLAVSIGIGIYDHLIKYLTEREQFGRKIAKFQLVQEKLVRVMGNVQASLHLMAQITKLYEEGKSSIGKFAMAKAWVTSRIREAAALARESLGGNGIMLDNYLIKAFMDMEGVYTYEGTYDINTLVAGRELTGYAAFK